MSSNETFYEYDSDQMFGNKSAANSPNSSNEHGQITLNNGEKGTVSVTNFDQRMFELGGNVSGVDSENDADKNSSSTFDLG